MAALRNSIITILTLLFLFSVGVRAQGNVYLVLGSDTGIWDGLNTNTFHDTYRFHLYTDPTQNAYKVMSSSFREGLKDSYGNTLKMTWWMMGGNTFRYGTNTNIPIPNTMVMHLMKKYHLDAIKHWGDELSLHYHTWVWFDLNGDGKFYWNQALNFEQTKDDFDLIMEQYLLEENIFPVSFRSGWHYMDNSWQNYLNTLLPYSMHDDYPHVRADTVEPTGNIYDWSQSASEFVPFHPSTTNYQIPGDGKGWDVRSIYMASMDTTLLGHVFSQAKAGIDQVVCLWAHLPEADFPDNIKRIDSLAHEVAAKYPGIKFRYCTAVEAMQRWLKSSDTTSPNVVFNKEESGDKIRFTVQTDEPIFQAEPYVVIKDIYQRYEIAKCQSAGTDKWVTSDWYNKSEIAKAGVAVTDTVGNLTTAFINILPDDEYIDNKESGYHELSGTWGDHAAEDTWDLVSRSASVKPGDSASVKWTPKIAQSGLYNIFVRVPSMSNPVENIKFSIFSNGTKTDSVLFDHQLEADKWIYLGTQDFTAGGSGYVTMTGYGSGTASKIFSADVMKFSALVPKKHLYIPQYLADFGLVSQDDSTSARVVLTNTGTENLTVTGISSLDNNITISAGNFPFIIPGMSSDTIEVSYHASKVGALVDTLFILSDDPIVSKYPVPVMAQVEPYFKLVDNENTDLYKESGKWSLSNAMAYGPTSRYAFLNQTPRASASFTTKVGRSGVYAINEIVPKTVNSSTTALYVFSIGGIPVDSAVVDQNEGSGDWVEIMRDYIPGGVEVELKVIDWGDGSPGTVLRADAVKFSILKEITGVNGEDNASVQSYRLEQNYPNPFNPSTIISYQLPASGKVTVKVYDILGSEVATLVNRVQTAGKHAVEFNFHSDSNRGALSSGIYFYRIEAGSFVQTKKMILLK